MMRRTFPFVSLLAAVCMVVTAGLQAQQAPTSAQLEASNHSPVPAFVPYTGVVEGLGARSVTVRFTLYAEQSADSPLWSEDQKVSLSEKGEFSVLLGAASNTGLPQDLFLTGEPRWLAIAVEGRELSRTLLSSVPYSMKAAYAESLQGQPAASFVTHEQLGTALEALSTAPRTETAANTVAATDGNGATGTIPLFTGVSTIGNSAITQIQAGAASRIGVNTTTPQATLDVNGKSLFRNQLALLSSASSAAGGASSPALAFQASSFSAVTGQPVTENFQWQAQAVGSNTASPSANLNLLFASGSATPAATGLSIAPNGIITFATGQTFPGGAASAATIAGMTVGNKSPVGTITGVTAGTGLTGGGTSGNVTLKLDSTKAPLLGVANTFTAAQTFTAKSNFENLVQIAVNTTPGTPAYPLDVEGGAASQPMVGIVTKGTDAALTLKNTGSGGREYWLDSGSNGAGVGAGNFSVWDAKAGARLTIDAAGEVGIGTQAPTGNQLAVVTGTDNAISATSGNGYGGVFTNNSTYQATVYATNNGNGNAGYFTNGSSNHAVLAGVAQSNDPGATAVYGSASSGTGVYGLSTNGPGVNGSSTRGSGVNGFSDYGAGLAGSSASGSGVIGQSENAWGVVGERNGTSQTFGYIFADKYALSGVIGDAGPGTLGAGVIGTADNTAAAMFLNNSNEVATLYVSNGGSGGTIFQEDSSAATRTLAGEREVLHTSGPQGNCSIGVSGTLTCTGQIKALMAARDGRHLETYTVQSAESWLEDYGSGRIEAGTGRVALEANFAQLVAAGADYHVFLTPIGDCKGLYIANKTAEGFEVHEMGGGRATIGFDYKIVARRAGHERERLVDATVRVAASRQAADKFLRPKQSHEREGETASARASALGESPSHHP